MNYDSDRPSTPSCAEGCLRVKTTGGVRHPSPVGGISPQVFLISQTPYRYLHHRSQRIADRLRDWGVPVTYVEESGGWRPYLSGQRRGLPRALGRSLRYHVRVFLRRPPNEGSIRPAPAGHVDIVEMPLSIPTTRFDRASLESLTGSLFRQTLAREVLPRRTMRLRTVALVNSPIWGMALRKGDFDRVVYDCIDDVSLYAGMASSSRFLEYERKLIQLSDAVITTAASLEAHVRGIDPRIPVFRIPNGVDVDWFQSAAADDRPSIDAGTLPRPIVGYVGTISGWLNIALAAQVALLLPSVTFLFVGPEDPWVDLEPLRRLPNVRFFGRVPYDDVPALMAACSACWIPFSAGRIVERTNPIKLFEYFALGKPVVSTPMPELETYRRRGLLWFGRTAEELAEAIRKALDEDDEGQLRRRVRVARKHSWDILIADLYRVLRGESPSARSLKGSAR